MLLGTLLEGQRHHGGIGVDLEVAAVLLVLWLHELISDSVRVHCGGCLDQFSCSTIFVVLNRQVLEECDEFNNYG
jgi:hypothetical protein